LVQTFRPMSDPEIAFDIWSNEKLLADQYHTAALESSNQQVKHTFLQMHNDVHDHVLRLHQYLHATGYYPVKQADQQTIHQTRSMVENMIGQARTGQQYGQQAYGQQYGQPMYGAQGTFQTGYNPYQNVPLPDWARSTSQIPQEAGPSSMYQTGGYGYTGSYQTGQYGTGQQFGTYNPYASVPLPSWARHVSQATRQEEMPSQAYQTGFGGGYAQQYGAYNPYQNVPLPPWAHSTASTYQEPGATSQYGVSRYQGGYQATGGGYNPYANVNLPSWARHASNIGEQGNIGQTGYGYGMGSQYGQYQR